MTQLQVLYLILNASTGQTPYNVFTGAKQPLHIIIYKGTTLHAR